MRVYCVHFIIKVEDTWFSREPPFEAQRSVASYFLETRLFLATDSESAYENASKMIDGLGDANHDGPGDRTDYSCPGIYDLADLTALGDLVGELASTYGLEVDTLKWNAQDALVPRSRGDLAVFRHGA